MTSDKAAEQVVSSVVEPGERILWAGRPDATSMILRVRNRVRLRYAGAVVLLPAVAWLAARLAPPGLVDSLDPGVMTEPPVLVTALALLIVIPGLSVSGVRRFERYARSLVYGLTDRRLLVIEGTEIVDAYTPEKASRITLRPRGRGRADVVFGRRAPAHADRRRTKDPVQREREIVAFKAIEDAESVQARIETWLAGHVRNAAADAGTATVEGPPPEGPAAGVGQRTPETGPGDARRQTTLATPGLHVRFPASWQVRVRRKKKPYGRTFLDREVWRDPDEAGAWNVVRADGPLRSSVEIEVFETRPTVTFESLSNSRLGDATAGRVAATNQAVRINGLTGFTVTRRNDVNVDTAGTATVAAIVVLEQTTVLHDGTRQVCARCTWPEESDDLGRIVAESVHSIRLD